MEKGWGPKFFPSHNNYMINLKAWSPVFGCAKTGAGASPTTQLKSLCAQGLWSIS